MNIRTLFGYSKSFHTSSLQLFIQTNIHTAKYLHICLWTTSMFVNNNRLYRKNVAVSQCVCTGQTVSLVNYILHYIYYTINYTILYINLYTFTYTHILCYILHYIKTCMLLYVYSLSITYIIQEKTHNTSLYIIILLQWYYITLITTYTI